MTPSMSRLRKVTVSLTPALMTMPLVPAASMPAICTPPPSIVIDLVMVTAPKPPGSMTLISPPAAVLEIAPANVLQGAVRLHGLASLPTPETQVRVAWALAGCTAIVRHAMPTGDQRNLYGLKHGLPLVSALDSRHETSS